MKVDYTAKERVEQAIGKALLRRELAFFRSLILKLEYVQVPQHELHCGTAETDGKYVYYCSEYVDTLTTPQVLGLVLHEILHPALGHLWRMAGRDHEQWNIAADFEVDHMLKEFGVEPPPPPAFNQEWYNKHYIAETIYPLLPQKQKRPRGGGGCGPKGEPDPNGKSGKGKSGDKEGNQPRPGIGNDLREPKGQSTADREKQRREWGRAIEQAAKEAKRYGNTPGCVDRLIEALRKPQVDWVSELREFIQVVTREDYSWEKPDPTYLQRNIYVPSLYSRQFGTGIIVDDVSGSTYGAMYTRMLSELQAIHSEVRPQQTYVVYCDTKIQHVDEFTAFDNLTFRSNSGGGTDFRPPFKWVDEQGLEPDCLIYLTDLEGPFPDKEPDYPVLWVCFTAYTPKPPPFGQLLHVGNLP